MPTLRITARLLDTLTATSQIDYLDAAANIPGFGLRVSPRRRTWFLLYRSGGRRKRLTIGTYPPMGLADARQAGGRALRAVQVEQADPAAARKARRSAQTFGDLADEYLRLYAKPRKRSWRDDGRQLRSMVLPRWKNRPAIEIEKREISTLIDAVAVERGITTGNRLHALLSKLFRWAVSKDKLPANPMSGLQKPAPDTSRARELSDDEIRTFWHTLDRAEADGALLPGVALALRLRLLTAQRGDMVYRMRWAHVDLAARIWDVPAADMKGKRPHVVPLSPAVVALLTTRRAQCAGDATYVLQGERARRKRLGVTAVFELPDFQLRDLRRTAATGMTRAGISRFVVERVLAHADRTIGGVYDRYEYLNEKRVALDTWARRVAQILEPTATDTTVLPFASRS